MESIRDNPRLTFYRKLQQLNPEKPEVRRALLFTRSFSDLARRVQAALNAQTGEIHELPANLALTGLQACLEGDSAGFASRFSENLANENPAPPAWPGELGGWLAEGFNPAIPFAGSYQVWVGRQGSREVSLFGPSRTTAPPAPFRLCSEPPVARWLKDQSLRPAAIIAHYDVHGIAMLALTERCLNQAGTDQVDSALGFEWTGDISKLWKRAVPKTLTHEQEYSTVFLVDCSVHSRRPEYTLNAVRKLADVPNTRLVIIDHHEDTCTLAPDLVELGAQVVLTDVYTCGLYGIRDAQASELMLLGALGDKLPEAFADASWPELDRIMQSAEEFHRRMIHFSPTPKELKDQGIYPLKALWDALVSGERIEPLLAEKTLGELPREPEAELPQAMKCGNAVVVTQKPAVVGRMWYRMLERLMLREQVPYAIALRVLNGRRANFLLLNRWNAIEVPPVRLFVPDQYLPRCLGHPSAVWADLELYEGVPFLESVLESLNEFFDIPAGCDAVSSVVKKNILESAEDLL